MGWVLEFIFSEVFANFEFTQASNKRNLGHTINTV